MHKKSKSEILLDLSDPAKHDAAVREVLKNPQIRVPVDRLFGDNREKWRSYVVENGCRRYYRFFDGLSDRTAGGDLTVVERLKRVDLKTAKGMLGDCDLPSGLELEGLDMQVFYYSCLVYKYKRPADEYALLKLAEKACASIRSRKMSKSDLFRNLFVRFSNPTLLKYIRNSIMCMQEALEFLRFVACRLNKHVIELWFDERLRLDDQLFSRLRRMSISANTRFDREVFECLLKYRVFRRHVFNYWQNTGFVLGMREFCNRADYEFYYNTLSIDYRSSCPPPHDYKKYTFFRSVILSGADYQKLREYQVRHGHNVVLNMFVEKNIDVLLNSVEEIDINIIIDTVRYDNQAVNLKVWESLKTNEDLFRQVVGYFRSPCEPVLYSLLTRRYDLCSPEDAESYIKFCYEDELLEYFQTVEVEKTLGLVNDWNKEFFLTVFWNKMRAGGAADARFLRDVDLILDFVLGRQLRNTHIVSKILDRIFDTDSDRVYARLDRNLRFIYACRNKRLLERFRKEASGADMGLQERAHLYEIEKLGGSRAADVRREGDIVRSLFEISFVAGDDSRYYFVEYFDALADRVNERIRKEDLGGIVLAPENVFLNEPEGHGQERIEHYLNIANSRTDEQDIGFQLSFLLGHNLKNKYTLFIIFDRIIEILTGPSCSMRTLVLRFLVPSLFCRDNVHRFINALTPLLNSPSSITCQLSKACLLKIDIESKEIQGIFGDLTQALIDKEYVPMFFQSLRSLVFNNYLCFNSLNLILQILFRYINDFTDDVFEILAKLSNIIKDKDITRVGPLIFNNLNRFVVNNHYHTEEVLRVSRMYCFYAVFDDYRPLIEHFSVFRISLYTVGILKARGDTSLNTRVIEHVMGLRDGIPYPFIAAACELNEFCVYFDRFLATLKDLFTSSDGSKRDVAVKAFREVYRNDKMGFDGETRERVVLFIIRCAIYEDYPVRLACLDIIDYLPLLFVMRNDQHFLVRKKAYEMWKAAVDHPNKMLRAIYTEVLDFTQYIACRAFREALSGAVSEMATKYPVYLEMYINDDGVHTSLANKAALSGDGLVVVGRREMKEFILLEAVRINKLTSLALRFCIDSQSSSLFHVLYKSPDNREALMGGIDAERLFALCSENSELASALYKNTANPRLVGFLGDHEVFNAMVELERRCDFRTPHMNGDVEALNVLVDAVRSSVEVENFVYRSNPVLSFFYIGKEREDHGLLGKIFMKAFEGSNGIDRLVTPENMKYVKHCSFARVANHGLLLSLLVAEDDRKSFERAIEIISSRPLPEELAFRVCAFLLRNYLSDTRKELSLAGIRAIYGKGHDLGYFQGIIERSVMGVQS